MDTTSATPAAPAQPVASPEPASQSAVQAAVASGSTSAYREAKRAERAGKPLPSVSVETTPAPAVAADAAPTPESKPLSRKEREQQDANERTRKAVEAATADLRAELERVKASTAAPRSEATPPATAPTAPEPPKFPKLETWAAQPENRGKSIDDYLDARDEFREQTRREAARIEQEFKGRADALTKLGQAFTNRMTEARAADPDLASKVPPAMRDPVASTPLSAMTPDQLKTAKFSNLVAEAALRSERPAELLKHLHANQAETVRVAEIAQREGPAAALGALRWIDQQLASPATPMTPKPKTLTSAPAPAETLGTRPAEAVDPKAAAIKRGDTRAYRQFKLQQKLAERGH